MNEHLLEYVACAVLLVPLAVCAVCISVGSLWAIAFIIKAIGAVNRIGALRNGRSKCPDLGYRLMSSRTPVTVKLLLLLRAYTHHDKHVRRFGEDALRYLKYSPYLVLVAVIMFEFLFLGFSVLSLLGAMAIFSTSPERWLVGVLLLVPPILIVPVIRYTYRANKRRKRLLARLLAFADRLRRTAPVAGSFMV